MSEVTFAELQAGAEDVRHVRKTLGAVLALAPEDAAPIATISSDDGLKVQSLPTDYLPVGLLLPEGIDLAREVEMSSVPALGHFSSVRDDPESGSRTLTFRAYEIHRRNVVELSESVDLSAVVPDATSGEVTYEIPDMPLQSYYRAFLLGFDGNLLMPWFDGNFYPRVAVTSFPSETWNKSDPRSAEIGLTIYEDPDLGFSVRKFHAGAGFKSQSAALGWTA